MRAAIALLLLIGTLAAAHAFGLGKEGKNFGRLGSISNKKGSVGPLTNLRITNTGDFRVTNTGDNRAVFP